MKKKLISTFLAFAMVLSLLPAVPAGAIDTTVKATELAIHRINDVSEVPTDWDGHVLTYSEVKLGGSSEYNGVRIDVGVYNTQLASAFYLPLQVDYDVLNMCNSEGVVQMNTFTKKPKGPMADDVAYPNYNEAMIGDEYLSDSDVVSTLTSTSITDTTFGIFTTFKLNDVTSFSADKEDNLYKIYLSLQTQPMDKETYNAMPGLIKKYTRHNDMWGTIESQPVNEVMPVYSLYFKLVDGKSMDDITADTITAWQNDPQNTYSGGRYTDGDHYRDTGVYYVNFPAPALATQDVTVTVKDASDNVYEGATVTLSGSNANGAALDPALTAATNDQGVVTFSAVEEGDYTAAVSGTGTRGGALYALSGGPVNITVAAGGVTPAAPAVTVTASEVKNAYPFTVRVIDKQGAALDLSGATIQFGGAAVTTGTAGADKGLPVTTPKSGVNELSITGLSGYQPVSAQLDLTAEGTGTTTGLALASANTADAQVTGTQAMGFVVTVKAAKNVTQVTLPIPVPTLDGVSATAEALEGMSVTYAPAENTPTYDALAAELAPKGSVTTSRANGLLQVQTAPAARAAETAGTTVTAIDSVAELLDGYYTMTVGGAGIDAKSTTVTVLNGKLNGDDTTLVNVGGIQARDGIVTGGVTGTVAMQADESGNRAIALNGSGAAAATLTESTDGTITTADGGGTLSITVAEGSDKTDLTGGLLDSDTVNNDLTATVATDPAYQVVIAEAESGSTADAPVYEAKIYLKNATASGGSFGMYFDPAIIDLTGKTFDQAVTLNNAANIELPQAARQLVAPAADSGESGYVTFTWNATFSGGAAVDATSGPVLLATVQLPIVSDADVTANLESLFSNTTIYTMEFEATTAGKALIQSVKDATESDEEYAELYNELMSGTWRTLDMAGKTGAVKLENEKATRGGFYQITSLAEGSPVPADIRSEFVLPETFTAVGAGFHVTDTVGADIQNAQVDVYATPADGAEFDLSAATPAASKTTNTDGRTSFTLEPGTYHYVVSHPSFWTYPDGTVNTDKLDNPAYDTFTLAEDGTVTLTANAKPDGEGGWTVTDYASEYISPVMDAKSYHKVLLDVTDSKAVLSGLTKAYNGVDYEFTIQPAAGYDWNLSESGTYKDMDDVAAALTATLFDADATATSAVEPEDMYQTGSGAALSEQIVWDSVKNKFRIPGAAISGDAVGEVEFPSGAPDWFDSLRSGDIKVAVLDGMLAVTDLTISATAGAGGKVDLALDDTLGATDTNATAQTNQTAISETLSNGRATASLYTFHADSGNTIDKVVVNGVDYPLTEEQKKVPFSYQFTNISANQTITVTFKNAMEEPVSEPVLTVTAGSHGAAQVTGQDSDAWAGRDSKTYQMTKDTAASVVLTPDAGYQFDALLVDGAAVALPDENKDASGYYTLPYTAAFAADDMAAGSSHTVTVTFKEAKDKAQSLEAVVTATVEQGFGAVPPIGVSIHNVGDTPSYQLSPEAGWTVKNDEDSGTIVVNGADVSHQIVHDADTDSYSYTMEPLTGDSTLAAAFAERGYQVVGKVKTVLGAGQTTKASATLTFVRAAVPGSTDKTTYTYTTTESAAGVSTVDGEGNMGFDLQVPAGTWTVTVSKQGYLDYVIRDFVVDADAAHTLYFGDGTSDGMKPGATEDDPATESTSAGIKPIVLVIGDAFGDGLSVYSDDVGVVASGWLSGASETAKRKGDLDESTLGNGSDSVDMTALLNNYGKLRIRVAYTAFCNPAP